ncbi:metallophosphoesterase [Candidatus Dojkabacteria bacterium]|nr:metallophosphoesterase [Candidatus Dojkabacteria bacterium]
MTFVNFVNYLIDTIIALATITAISIVVINMFSRNIKEKLHTRLRTFIKMLNIPAIFCLLLISYSVLIEPFTLVKVEQDIDLEDFEENPTKIILISDLHVGIYQNGSKLKSVVEEINAQKDADYVLIIGDVVNSTDKYFDELDELENIDKSKQVYFAYGNHDYQKDGNDKIIVPGLEEKLISLDIIPLKNEYITIENGIKIGGILDVWTEKQDYSFINDIEEENTMILMCHNPDCVIELNKDKDLKNKVDLVVSGHTHGGEMRLPIIGSIAPQGLPTELPDRYDKHEQNYNGIRMFITSGIGNIGVRARLANPPEVVILTIK